MTDEQILDMLKELVEELDYDLYKELNQEPEAYEDLAEIVKRHMGE